MSEARRADQDLARIAHDILPERVSKELRTRMRQLPARLRGGGLAATYAFVFSKAKNDPNDELGYAYHLLAVKVADRVAKRRLLRSAPREMSPRVFLKELADAKPAEYARTAAEIDALAVWLGRLSDALYDGPADDEESADDSR